MRLLFSLTVALVIGLPSFFPALSSYSALAATYYVDADNCPGPGIGTMGDPFCKIQDGITAASTGDTVEVAAGTYNEKITMKSGVVIQGAGAGNDPAVHSIIDGGGNGSVVIAKGVDSAAKLDGFTITNGSTIGGGGMRNINSSPTVSNCTFSGNSASYYGGGMENYESSSPTVINCTFSGNSARSSGGGMYNTYNSSPTLTNCTFSGNSAEFGGGMYNYESSSPTLTNCTFSGNSADDGGRGGGMTNWSSSSPVLTDCVFSGNSAKFGGGIYNYESSSPTLTNCTFSGNSVTGSFPGGGGMSNWSSSPVLTDCIFSENSAGDYGGGMHNRNSSPVLTDCVFSGNSARIGGGIFNYESSSPTLTNCTFSGNSVTGLSSSGGGMYNQFSSPKVINCTFSGNSAGTNGGGMYNEDSSPRVTNCILWGDSPVEIYNSTFSSASVTYSDIQRGYPGTGNINTDPLFVDPDGPDNIPGNQDDDFHLKANSPCIDSGDNSAPDLPATDFEGDARKIDVPTVADTGNGTPPLVDMGADEYLAGDFPWEIFIPAFIKK